MEQFPRFIDFEASSLRSASYPIEVAWNALDGTIEAHLISPAGIDRWTDWSVKAEQLHGISRTALRTHGKSPAWLCRRMNQQLAGHVVYSDEPTYDEQWLTELFAVVYGDGPAFELRHVNELLVHLLRPQGNSVQVQAQIEAMKHCARREVGRQHRAAWDVAYLVTLYKMAKRSQGG